MLIESYMQVLMYYIENHDILYFWIFTSTATPSSILFNSFVKFQDQSFHIQGFANEFILWIYLVFIQFISILIFVTFFIYIFLKCIFWYIVY